MDEGSRQYENKLVDEGQKSKRNHIVSRKKHKSMNTDKKMKSSGPYLGKLRLPVCPYYC